MLLFLHTFSPTSFVGYGKSHCPSLDAWKVLAGCGSNCKLILVTQHLKVFSLTLLQMHSLSAPRDLFEPRVWKLGHQLRLPTGSWLFSRQVPSPLLWSQSSWRTSHKAQSLRQKDTAGPRVSLKHGFRRHPTKWKKWAQLHSGRKEGWIQHVTHHEQGLLTLGIKIPSILSGGRKAQKMLIFSAGPDQGGWGKPTLQTSVGFSYGLDAARP